MRIVQQPSRFQRTEFEFGDRELKYVFESEREKTAFTVPYTNISNTKSLQVLRTKVIAYFGFTAFVTAFVSFLGILEAAADDQNSLTPSSGNFWLFFKFFLCIEFIGLCIGSIGCIGAKKDATVISCNLGRILIYHDLQHQRILDEIAKRRKFELKRINGTVDTLNHPELELKKFLWLKDQGIISLEEFTEARTKIYAEAKIPPLLY